MPAPDPIPDLLKAANEASGKAFALWITFISVTTYLAISIGTTTHLQLLLAGPVKLPLLGVDLPLFAFYGFAPLFFTIVHLYVLMQLYLLARLLRLFDDELKYADIIEHDRRQTRGQLDKFVFTQCLIGAPQDGIVRLFLWAVVLLSFVVGPVLLLIGFQLRFLPYHSIEIVYLHRITLLLDLILLMLLWPKIVRSGVQPIRVFGTWPIIHHSTIWGFSSIVVFTISIFVATIPGELVDFGDLPRVIFQRNLSIPNERLVEEDEEKPSKLTRTLTLRGRDLRQGNFLGSDLRKADLAGANLQGAFLSGTDLSRAHLEGANFSRAILEGANLSGANLKGAILNGAKLNGAILNGAILNGANLRGADLSAASLREADLRLANLASANLTNSDLSFADLTGAILGFATWTGAHLRFANLTVTNIGFARDLTQTQLDEACGKPELPPVGLTLDKPCPSRELSVPPLNPGATP